MAGCGQIMLSTLHRLQDYEWQPPGVYLGFLSTRITESPLKNILLMYLSLFTGLVFFFPLPAFGTSVHISLTFSSTMLQWRSNALILPSSFLLFRTLIST